ncbi:MAG TPA: aromatic ring-hydroxylating dioxygenase subunit alpha [Ktedonobacteraceae bacterium]|nr:aromatic ring-hydroxylating dioxygenase subunit alpha [Ktedonobacteraceae bacterium]
MTTRTSTPFLSTFPGRYYYDQAIFELEQERVFSAMWYYACRADEVPLTGSYKVVTVGKESVIVARDKEGALHAFLNVCRHRGARLCSEAAGQLKGSIQCRYHAWTYGLDGRLIGAPNVMSDERFDKTRFGLMSVALHVWEGLVFLNLAENPQPFEEQLNDPRVQSFGDVAPYERYQIGHLKVAQSITYDVRANWKLIIENTLECYHCGPMHPELCALIPLYRSGKLFENGEMLEGAALGENVEAFTMTGKASRPSLPGLLPVDTRRYYGFLLLPNVFINLLSDHVAIDTLVPLAADRTLVTSAWLFDPDEMAKPTFDPSDAVGVLDLVNRQDWEVCELAQQGVSSRAYARGGNYAPDEHHIRGFVEYVLEKLGH